MIEQQILDGYRRLQQIADTPEFLFLWRSKSKSHEQQFLYVEALIRNHPYALIDMLRNWQKWGLSDDECTRLLLMGSHGGSVAREHNLHWTWVTAELRQHMAELSPELQRRLDWLLATAGW